MPSGRWISLQSEYGDTARWIAGATAPQEFDPFDVAGDPGDGPEPALVRLSIAVAQQGLAAVNLTGVTPPAMSFGAAAFARAWRTAFDALPNGWWITEVTGFEGRSEPPGWLASAAGGPDHGFDGEEGMGSTPEEALEALARQLEAR